MAGISDIFFYLVYILEFILFRLWHFSTAVVGIVLLYSEADNSLCMPCSLEPGSHKTGSNQFHTSPSFSL